MRDSARVCKLSDDGKHIVDEIDTYGQVQHCECGASQDIDKKGKPKGRWYLDYDFTVFRY